MHAHRQDQSNDSAGTLQTYYNNCQFQPEPQRRYTALQETYLMGRALTSCPTQHTLSTVHSLLSNLTEYRIKLHH